ncbi:ABC transporter permease [Mangrovicoccus algicola]|uniref:ABC transporter permease subunit n=1 Tax=Mangrovicoccus algicola TaxID=2771008 RepID=A0A8J6YWD3_9RHOB|nr:ABC transporter permease subunit [Mangrovicoccus algicola]MBE3640413.1 ABC transporter permease subunit [Mangrovicoccus algicola]
MRGPGRALPLLGLILLWEVLARATAQSFVIAAPTAIAAHLATHAELLLRALGTTAWNAAQGYLWGNLAGIALALAAVSAPRAERILSILALFVFCLPLVATGPVLRVLSGPGNAPQVALAALAVYYTTFLPVLVGLRAAPQSWFELVRSHGRGPLAALWLVRLPAALPYLAAGLQIAVPAAFLGAMVGEFTGAERGLGMLTLRALRGLDLPATWAIAVIAALVSGLAFHLAGRLARWLDPAPPALLPAAPAGARPLRLAGPLADTVLALAAGGLLWAGLMELFALPDFFAKRPGDVWAFLVTDAQAGAHRARLAAALGQTLAMAGPGYLAGLALGAGLAAGLTLRPGLAGLAMPLAVALRAVPIIATAPVLIWALGRGAAGTVTVVAVMIFFPTLVACLSGIARTPRAVLDLFDSHAAPGLQRLLWAQLPAILPAFFAAARMAVPAAILAVTTAEWLATGRGIGALMAVSAATSDYAMLWSATAATGLAALAAHGAVAWAERAVLSRHAAEQVAR